MTRRVIKHQPHENERVIDLGDGSYAHQCVSTGSYGGGHWHLPYNPGDVLWVREGWAEACELDDDDKPATEMRTYYRADGEPFSRYLDPETDEWLDGIKWGSPIFMPRWASRITLRVTDVKIERLQDISEDDAKAEGLACLSKDGGRVYKWGIPDRDGLPGNDDDGQHWQMWCIGHKPAFAALWNSIHGDDAWNANPWVAAITFEKEPRP